MTTIRWKRNNVLIFCFSTFMVIIFTYKGGTSSVTSVLRLLFGDDTGQPCNRDLIWSTPAPTVARPLRQGRTKEVKTQKTVIGLLGPPGSGVQWLRYLIEQMTGVYTGSVDYDYPEVFAAEGETSKVVTVMAHDAAKLPTYGAAIVIYRNLKDTIRTHYAEKQGKGVFLEAPLSSYYGGKDWPTFVAEESQNWIKLYNGYLDSGVPLLIVGFEELEDVDQLTPLLLRISNFLHVPVRSSVVECVIDRANEYDIKPRPLKAGFQPFTLVDADLVDGLEDQEREVEESIADTRERFSPNVW